MNISLRFTTMLFLIMLLTLHGCTSEEKIDYLLIPFLKSNGKYIYVKPKTMEPIKMKEYDGIDFFSKDLGRVYNWEDGGKIYGFVDKHGVEVIPLKYHDARQFNDGIAAVQLDANWGFIDKNGKEIITLKYQDAREFNEGLAPVQLDKKWGFIDKKGVEVIPFNYQEASGFNNGIAPVKLNEKWGFVDKNGVEIIPFKYGYIGKFSEGYFPVELDKKWGFIDKKGIEVIPLKYDFVEEFKNSLAKVNNDGNWIYIDKNENVISDNRPEIIKEESKFGLKNKKGEIILNPKYDFIHEFDNGLATVITDDAIGTGYAGLIDEYGKEIISPKYIVNRLFLYFIFENNYAWVVENDQLFYIDKEGREYREVKKSELEFLKGFDGKNALFDLKILQHSTIKRRLKKLLGEEFEYMTTYWSSDGSIKIVQNNYFYTGGFMAHQCCVPYFSLMADIDNDILFVEITKENGNKKLYSEGNAELPEIFKAENFSTLK